MTLVLGRLRLRVLSFLDVNANDVRVDCYAAKLSWVETAWGYLCNMFDLCNVAQKSI